MRKLKLKQYIYINPSSQKVLPTVLWYAGYVLLHSLPVVDICNCTILLWDVFMIFVGYISVVYSNR